MAERKTPDKIYHGVIVPMVTPLTAQGELDEPALRRIIDFLVAGGVQGLFVLGTTGEGASAPREIRARIVHLAVEFASGRVQVYAGIPSTVVDEAVDAAREYLRRGAAAVVAPLPGYYQLTPDEQFRYYAALVERIRGPLILYDIPLAAHMSIDQGVIEHLRVFPNVVGIKDSSGDRERLRSLLGAYVDDPGFAVLVGTTALASFGLQRGADGFIPSAGNLNPSLCARMCTLAQKGDWALMEDVQRQLDALQAEIAGETIGRGIAFLKKEMAKRGLCGPKVFLPLQQAE
jgi:dihydrodipicolinate synthase/N-acetylneuraminate lyase